MKYLILLILLTSCAHVTPLGRGSMIWVESSVGPFRDMYYCYNNQTGPDFSPECYPVKVNTRY